MIGKILETLTGKDDVERIAYKGDSKLLYDYLRTRPLLIPKRPTRSLDPATFTEQQLLELIEHESRELDGQQLELWILDVDGKKVLPAFSSRKKMEEFSARISKEMNRVFSLGCFEALLPDVVKGTTIDIVGLNLFSQKRWELTINRK
jgi:hypothetical protein